MEQHWILGFRQIYLIGQYHLILNIMAKKQTILSEWIVSKEYTGYLDQMPQELKDAVTLRNPKAAKLFEVKQ